MAAAAATVRSGIGACGRISACDKRRAGIHETRTPSRASDGAEAFAVAERLERDGHALDLVLTDVVMPGGSGREFVERLRTIRPSVPVLYMSAYTNDAILRHLARNGEVSILEKPFTPIGLLERVHEELARTRSMPEPGA